MSSPADKTVLIVDDEEDVRDYLAAVLEDAGFNVETAVDGNDALEKVKRRVPDFISLDLVMPEKTGIKFLYELRHNKQWSKIPVLIVTAHAHDSLGKRDLDDIMAGKSLLTPGGYLEKPVQPESYVWRVCESLGLPLPGDAPAPARGRDEAKALLDDADPEQVAEVLRMLKRTR